MLNHIVIHGRLTKDPELRRTQAGIAVTSFTVACDREYSKEDGKRETDFIDVSAWRQTAEFISSYFRKGQEILVSGRLQSRKWDDQQGNKRTAWEILVERVDFCGPKGGGTDFSAPLRSAQNDNAPRYADYAPLDGDDDECPF